MRTILTRDDLDASEKEIFEALVKWFTSSASQKDGVEYSRDQKIELVKACVNLPDMTIDEIYGTVRPSQLFSSEELLDLMEKRVEVDCTDYRYSFCKERTR